ncbi:hypothetical protein [Ponticoccus alexandrii]|uniref:Uncharacterized protein n=1 Tax=Ponticoccus alexandrii TaxID=1943633 RepID=A0ABX7FBD1_9RHOB|nr:hypothetical protein [Ponticoccus alexandrii]QRF67789.1 hypothetical protein GQA70_16650 [Ponticoccus alexandrii]
MNVIEKVRLNREEFVNWLGKSLSGPQVLPRSSISTIKKPSDVVLVGPENQMDASPIVFIPQEQMHDFFAFVSTYTNVRPFTAFFRVLPLEFAPVFENSSEPARQSRIVGKCVAGAAMAEAWVASSRGSERPRNVYPLLLSTLSSALGQAVQRGYDSALVDWIAHEWVEMRGQSADPNLSQDLSGIKNAWSIMGLATSPAKSLIARDKEISAKEAKIIVGFLSAAIEVGSIKPEMLRALAPLSPVIDLEKLLSASREERISSFNRVILNFKERGDRGLKAEFVAGLILAISGNGSFDLLRSAREFDGWLEGATTWFGICAALFEDGSLLTYGNSAGRRFVRDLVIRDAPFEEPRGDINSTEYRFLLLSGVDQFSSSVPNSLDVEIVPGVLSRVTSEPEEKSAERRYHAEELFKSLDEARYIIDRARHAALSFAEIGRAGSRYRAPRSTRSKK